VLVSLNLGQQDRVQGPAIDTGLKFNSNDASQSTVSVSLARTRDSSGASEGDLEGGIELVTETRCRAGDTRASNYGLNPDLKGYVVHQVTAEVS
jgi:hypothetical protein